MFSTLWIFGVPLYIVTLAGIIISGYCMMFKKDRSIKILSLICLVVCASILSLCITQGVLTAALQRG